MNNTSLEHYLRENGSLTYSNVGTSMLPLLRAGKDLLQVQKKTDARCRTGDVVLYRRTSGQLVLHRIIAVRPQDYVLLGDNCTEKEYGITDAEILGVMTGFVRNGRQVSAEDPAYRLYTQGILRTATVRLPVRRTLRRLKRRLRTDDRKNPAAEQQQQTTQDLIYLAACAVNDATPDAARVQTMALPQVYRAAQRQMMTAIAAMALECAGVQDAAFTQAKAKALRKAALLEADRAALIAQLEARGIRYLPLKGAVWSALYPKFGMREMSDQDLLIDPAAADTVRAIMEELGFSVAHFGVGYHDDYQKPPVSHFELHRSLFGAHHDPKLRAYYADPTPLLQKDAGNRCGYHFSPTEGYLYLIAHSYKHFSGAGTGLRTLLDLELYLRRFEAEMDADRVAEALRQLDLTAYEETLRRTARQLFGAAAESPAVDAHAFSAVYGTTAQQVQNGIRKRGGGVHGRLRYICRRLVLPQETVKDSYPFFARHRLLLPLLPACRLGRALRAGNGRLRTELKTLLRSTEK